MKLLPLADFLALDASVPTCKHKERTTNEIYRSWSSCDTKAVYSCRGSFQQDAGGRSLFMIATVDMHFVSSAIYTLEELNTLHGDLLSLTVSTQQR